VLLWLLVEAWMAYAFGPLAAACAGLAAVFTVALRSRRDGSGDELSGSRILGWFAVATPLAWWAAGHLAAPLGWAVPGTALLLVPAVALAVVVPVELLLGCDITTTATVLGAATLLTGVVAACLVFGTLPLVIGSAAGTVATAAWIRIQRVRWGDALAPDQAAHGVLYLAVAVLLVSAALLSAPGAAALLGWSTLPTAVLLVLLGLVLWCPVVWLGERLAAR
jgi:hypothetical protein